MNNSKPIGKYENIINDILNPLKGGYEIDNVTLNKYLKNSKGKKKDIVKLINLKLFNISSKIITLDNKLNQIRSLVLVKNLDRKKPFKNIEYFRKILSKILNTIYKKLENNVPCNISGFLNYCKKGIIVSKKERFSDLKKEDRILKKNRKLLIKKRELIRIKETLKLNLILQKYP